MTSHAIWVLLIHGFTECSNHVYLQGDGHDVLPGRKPILAVIYDTTSPVVFREVKPFLTAYLYTNKHKHSM